MGRGKSRAETLNSAKKSVLFSLGVYWREQRITLLICMLSVITRVALPFLGILLPKIVIDLIEARVAPVEFITTVGGIALLMAGVHYLNGFCDMISNHAVGTIGISEMFFLLQDKRMEMDFALLEDPDCIAVYDKADKAIQSNHSIAMNIPRTLTQLLANALGFALYAAVIARVHPAILLLLLACSCVNWWALKRARLYMEQTMDSRSKINHKLSALFEAMRDVSAAKDIRLYSMFGWLNGLADRLLGERSKAEGAVFTKQMWAQLIEAGTILIRDGAAYAFLIFMLLRDQIALGDFVLAFAAIGALAEWVSGALVATSDLAKSDIEMSNIRAFLEYPNRMNMGKGAPLPSGAGLPPSITLRALSYTYPKAEKPTLRDINLTIRPGEKLAVVGANGAGKTTLVKLICGLYAPTEGEVLLNGIPALEYNRDEYFQAFSTVFQDIYLLTTDIAGNISQQTREETDLNRVARCLELSGLKQKVDSLPKREGSLLVKTVNQDGVELSGGEKQKLAMARALYKDAPVVILDEPTAALDPIAENEVYLKYAELAEGKTSIFISHRLASTRFCDRIVLIEGNAITEQGTHEELMRLRGTYANMFEVQASYYQNATPAPEEVEHA